MGTPVGNTNGLYIGSGSANILNNAQQLLTLLANSSSVGFYLTNSNTDVTATTLSTGVSPGTYGDNADIPIVTVGSDGRVTNITTVAIPTQTGTYSNANVAAYLTGTVTVGNLITTAGIFWSNGQPYSSGSGSIYGNANVAAYLPTYAGTLNNSSTIIGINANVAAFETYANATYATQATLSSFETYANATYSTIANAATLQSEITAANAAIVTANTAMKGYVDAANTIQSTQINTLNSGLTAANAAIVTVQSNLTAFEVYANSTFQTGGGSSYGNSNVNAYLSTGLVTTIVATGNIQSTGGNIVAAHFIYPNGVSILTGTGGTTYSNTNVAAYLSSGTDATINAINANITAANAAIQTLNANVGGFYTYANATYSTIANAASQESEITSLRGNITAANAVIQTLNANVGSFYTYANATYSTIANAAVLQSEINTINANIGSFYTYANATYQTTAGAYGNSNVAAYLPTYNGTIGTATGTVTIGGNLVTTSKLTTGNLVTSAGVFWANGTAYSTGSSFTGNLAGSTLFDSVNGRILANAYPQSDPGTAPPLWQNMKNNPPVYVNGVLQPAAGNNINGLININSYLMQTSGNVGLQSSYQTSTTRFTSGITNYQGLWPVTANVMQNTDRYRHTDNVLEVNLNGISWASSQSQLQNTVATQQNFLSIYGNGTLGTGSAVSGTVYIIPEGTALGSGLVANVNYVTGVIGQIQSQTTYGATNTANVIYARGFLPQVAPASNSVAITNAVGFHTPSGWVTAPGATGGLNIANRYAILNEDANSLIQTNANIVLAPGSGKAIVFSDGTSLTTAPSSSGGGLSWQSVQTSNFTAVAGSAYPVNTTSGNITVTLPSSPTAGQAVSFTDYSGNWNTAGVKIYGNGANIDGTSSNVAIVNQRETVAFVYIDSTQGWIPYSGFNTSTPAPVGGPYTASYLIVAGGGGGGAGQSSNTSGAGGGAGGYNVGNISLTLGTTYSFTVGAGGAGAPGASSVYNTCGTPGSNSTGFSLTMIGGGGGGSFNTGSLSNMNGGSGGGIGCRAAANYGTSPGSGTSGQGNAGGTASGDRASGGGGGAGAAGGVGSDGTTGGNGGVGLQNSITGTATYYAGGGGGGGSYVVPAGTGGLGGGGNGGYGWPTMDQTGFPGTANTGGGAGGGDNEGYSTSGGGGGNGGSGVVIVSVPTASYTGVTTGGPTVTTSGSNTIMTFTTSGSYTA